MNLRRLEYFIVLAQSGNLRKASDILGVTPPALSKAMNVLEDELEVQLWMKDGRNIILTDSGKKLLAQAPDMIERLKDMKLNLTMKTDGPQPVKIATFEVFSTYFLKFLEKLEWHHHSLQLHEVLPGELEKFVASGAVDFGITYMPVPHAELDYLKVTAIEMGVFTRKGAFKDVPQKELPFVVPILPVQGVPTRIRGLDGWPEDAYQRKVLHEVTLLESALELCRQGRVAGYFPSFIVHEHNERVRSEFQLERRKTPYAGRVCTADVFLVKRKSEVESPMAKCLAKAIRLTCKT